MLTAYDGHAISYDGSGNPTTYYNGRDWSFTWTGGRTLSGAANTEGDTETTVSYSYDLDGIRTEKTSVVKTYHTHHYDTSEVVPPTCTAAGYTRHTCACGAEKRTNETPAAGHQFNVEEIVAATCTEKGYTRGTCRVCGATEKYDYQSALGHHFNYTQPGEVVEPTCTEDGYTLRTCTVCGQDVKTEIVVMLGHNYRTDLLTGKTICTRCGDEQPGGGDIRPTTPGEVMDPEEPEDPIAPNADEGDAEDATTAPEDERVLVSEVTAVYSYLYASGKLLQEKVTTDGKTETHNFFYDNSGTPYAMQVDGTTYYYITNLQGDVVEMVDASGNTVARYTYSPYGKVLTAEGALAETNPLRYRGYYYDAESGLYYLQSRYYDPGTGRFINADEYAGTGQGMLGYNMFAYCNGSPIQFADYTGYAYCNATSETITCGIGGGIQFPKIGKSIGRVYDQVKRGLTCGLIMGIQLGISALVLCDDTTLATSSSVAEVERNSEREQKAIFPADPYAFNPRGLVRIVYPGSYNGAIIKWIDPVTGNDVFEWDEDLQHGPHYHTYLISLNGGETRQEIHHQIGEVVPEPWNTVYFGG